MTRNVEIAALTGLHHLAAVLADWHAAEWGHLYPSHVWNRDIAVGEFLAMAEPGSGDLTWVAFDGPSRDADAVLGSVSLIATDDLAGFEHVTPWLASMFVTPVARGCGVATALMDALLLGAREAGHQVVHLFTAGQEQFWADRGWSVVARVAAEGHPATVMAHSTDRRAARRAVSSQWCRDPDHRGAYSHLRLGGRPGHRRRLAESILPGLWFAGEATSAEHPATMHGAWFSGERAAEQVLEDAARDTVVVVGAGLAGIAAARQLQAAGRSVVVLESNAVVGGRVRTDTSTGVPLPLGGSWLHGDDGHPLRELVTTVPADWGTPALFAAGVGRLADDVVAAIEAAHAAAHDAFERADPDVSVRAVLSATLDTVAPDPLVRSAVESWMVAECEGLYGAPIGDVAANGGLEPFELPGGDQLVLSDLGALAQRLAAPIDVRCDVRVQRLCADGAGWVIEADEDGAPVSFTADAVIVTVPIGALGSDRIGFVPALPDDVRVAIGMIGCGPIAKVFATFDEVWWPSNRPVRLLGTGHLGTVVDVSAVAGRPTLVAFAVGESAHRVEQMSEHELCRLFDHELAVAGVRAWDAPTITRQG